MHFTFLNNFFQAFQAITHKISQYRVLSKHSQDKHCHGNPNVNLLNKLAQFMIQISYIQNYKIIAKMCLTLVDIYLNMQIGFLKS